jgi:hypothetical protein
MRDRLTRTGTGYPAGHARGTELFWAEFIEPVPGLGGSFAGLFADSYLRHIGFPIGSPHSSLADIGFTRSEFDRLTAEGVKGNAINPDLRRFHRSGGKLIIWHGWADPAIPAAGTLDYYQRLTQQNGGMHATQEWARMFVIPSMNHCVGGSRLTEFDPFAELITWVERDRAPERIIASGRDADNNVTRTRPVFPYPLRAKYAGAGSIDRAENFTSAPPTRPLRDAVDWVGKYLYARPGPTAP